MLLRKWESIIHSDIPILLGKKMMPSNIRSNTFQRLAQQVVTTAKARAERFVFQVPVLICWMVFFFFQLSHKTIHVAPEKRYICVYILIKGARDIPTAIF